MYRIKRCKECNQEVHIHKNNETHKHHIKNRCQHIPDKPYSQSEIQDLTK